MRSFIHALPGLWRTERRGLALPWLAVGFCTLALLISCGGGGGVGSGGTGATASGTVTGFGSVIVDGVRFDDSKASKRAARTGAEDSSGGVNSEIKLGQQVEFSFNGSVEDKGVASAITVAPRLIGVVTGTIPTVPNPPTLPLNAITVMGVQVAINTNAANGPVTQIDANGLSTSSRVEVHAIVDASGSLTATRIEDTAQLTDLLRGTVAPASGTTVSIHGVSVQLSGLTVADQGKVKSATSAVVFGQYDRNSGVFTATAARVVTQPATSKDDGYLSGYVAGLDEVNKQFNLNGVSVVYSGSPGLAQGQYVRVRGVFSSTVPNQFIASKVQQRSSENSSNGGDSEIDGTVTVSNPIVAPSTTGDITVRGVKITYTAATSINGCGATATFISGTTYVSVHGNTSATGVAATSIRCETEPSTGGGTGSGVTVERVGPITEIVLAGADSGTFKMNSAKGPITVKFNSLTVFPRAPILSGSDLAVTTPLEVEGYFESTAPDATFIATKIKKQS